MTTTTTATTRLESTVFSVQRRKALSLISSAVESQTIIGSKKIFGSEKILSLEIFLEKFGSKRTFGLNKMCVQKYFQIENFSGPTKFFVQKIWAFKEILGLNNFGV